FDSALSRIGAPAILKTRRLGYDGKGQARIARADDADSAFAALSPAGPLIFESVCAFEREVSIIAARGADGAFAAYDLCENVHADGILRRTMVPAQASPAMQTRARAMAELLAEELEYVGVFALELFLMDDGRLVANEMASRVHNSGHWTLDACAIS